MFARSIWSFSTRRETFFVATGGFHRYNCIFHLADTFHIIHLHIWSIGRPVSSSVLFAEKTVRVSGVLSCCVPDPLFQGAAVSQA